MENKDTNVLEKEMKRRGFEYDKKEDEFKNHENTVAHILYSYVNK
jgi:hypothetical protein